MTEFFASTTLPSLWVCLVIAIASSSISVTMTQSELFAPLRTWTDKVHYKLGYLFQCFHCLSHWVVFLGIAIYRPALIHSGYVVVDWIVSAFFTIALTTFTSGLIFKVFSTALAQKTAESDFKAKQSMK